MRFVGVGAAALALIAAGCTAGLPQGKPWAVDTSAWAGSALCAADPCSLDAYRTRDFRVDAALPAALTDGQTVQVHCFVPAPSPQRDPGGRDAYRWYLLTVGDDQVWAPDLALTARDDLRLEPTASGEHLAAGLDVCHSGVPGR